MTKRKTILCALAFATAVAANAQALQPQVVPDMNWDSNWFVSGGVGLSSFVGSPMGCHDIFGHVQPLFKASAGKWITPSFGLRATAEGYSLIAANMRKQHYQNYHLDLMYSIFTKAECPNSENRWDLAPYLGFGFLHNDSWGNMPFGFSYGVMGSYRVTDRLRIVAEVGGTTTAKSFDGLGASKGYGDNFVNLSLGVSYTLGENCWRTIGGKAIAKKEKAPKAPKAKKEPKPKKEKKSKKQADQDAEIATIIAEIALLQEQLGPACQAAECETAASQQCAAARCLQASECAQAISRSCAAAVAGCAKGMNQAQPSVAARPSTASEPVTILVPQGSADVTVHVSQNRTAIPEGQTNGVRLRNNVSRAEEPVKVLVSQGSSDVVARIVQDSPAIGVSEDDISYVYFAIGSAELDDDALDEVERLAGEAVRTGLKVRIVGSADSATGSYQTNKQLAKERAQAVARVFRNYGVRNVNIRVRSIGGNSEFENIPENRNCKIELYY